MNMLMSKKDVGMARVKMDKIGLSDISHKLYIEEDRITSRPFKKNGKYI